MSLRLLNTRYIGAVQSIGTVTRRFVLVIPATGTVLLFLCEICESRLHAQHSRVVSMFTAVIITCIGVAARLLSNAVQSPMVSDAN